MPRAERGGPLYRNPPRGALLYSAAYGRTPPTEEQRARPLASSGPSRAGRGATGRNLREEVPRERRRELARPATPKRREGGGWPHRCRRGAGLAGVNFGSLSDRTWCGRVAGARPETERSARVRKAPLLVGGAVGRSVAQENRRSKLYSRAGSACLPLRLLRPASLFRFCSVPASRAPRWTAQRSAVASTVRFALTSTKQLPAASGCGPGAFRPEVRVREPRCVEGSSQRP